MAIKLVKEIEEIFERLEAKIKKDFGGDGAASAHIANAKEELANHLNSPEAKAVEQATPTPAPAPAAEAPAPTPASEEEPPTT
jgi:hypothetical protein